MDATFTVRRSFIGWHVDAPDGQTGYCASKYSIDRWAKMWLRSKDVTEGTFNVILPEGHERYI